MIYKKKKGIIEVLLFFSAKHDKMKITWKGI
jgi:hypothetical protein